MSLVVAEVHNERVSLVADTKITHANDDARTRQVLENALPKLVILRPDLCVGIAGNDPVGVSRALVEHRHLPTEAVIEMAEGIGHASFVVASLGKVPGLWQIKGGEAENRTDLGRAWVGDRAGYEIFQQRYAEWPAGTDPGFLLLSSLQWLLMWNCVPSIGGYHTRVGTTRRGFRFVPDVANFGPEEMRGVASITADRLTMQLTTPPGVDPTGMSLRCAVGEDATFGALAYLVDPAGFGILFPHDAPWEPIVLRAQSLAELVERASAEHGQQLVS